MNIFKEQFRIKKVINKDRISYLPQWKWFIFPWNYFESYTSVCFYTLDEAKAFLDDYVERKNPAITYIKYP